MWQPLLTYVRGADLNAYEDCCLPPRGLVENEIGDPIAEVS